MRRFGLLAVLWLAASAHAAERKFVNEEYDLQKIADGVYSFIAPESDSGVGTKQLHGSHWRRCGSGRRHGAVSFSR